MGLREGGGDPDGRPRQWALAGTIGAERDAEITCDGLGAVIHDGGMCATRDLGRFGTVLLADGEVAGRCVAPASWPRASWTVDPDIRGALARPASGYLPGGWYRNQFWSLPRGHGDVLLCLGIHGQMVYVSTGTGTVAASCPRGRTLSHRRLLHDTRPAFDAVGATLAGLAGQDLTRRHGSQLLWRAFPAVDSARRTSEKRPRSG